ncbi:MAG: leucine--tRNA ligase [Candidatus Zipacnadales bacterium]
MSQESIRKGVFDHESAARKWQTRWEQDGIYVVDLEQAARPFYNLMMFPYPSAEGLHVGNVFAFTGADIQGRFWRMRGYDVFEPMGFDAFGIHSENYAMTIGEHPARLVERNVANFRDNQLKRLGAMFDWTHEVNTTDPGYYKWTQWIFTKLFEAGLAYKKAARVNWCPECKTVLADEQTEGGLCERHGIPVEGRYLEQWFLRITAYAQRLLDNLDWIDWSEVIKTAQRNWIGRSEGAMLRFPVEGRGETLEVFTTRPDTVFGATYMVMAPEHPLLPQLTADAQRAEVESYVRWATSRTEQERIESAGEKTGKFLGTYCLNPATGQRIPIWVADYVLIGYGSGAIMAVPAHDQRDFEFAKTFDLPLVQVVSCPADHDITAAAWTGEGVAMNCSGGRGDSAVHFDGLPTPEAKRAITKWLAAQGLAEFQVQYRLRDWCISRQRYWGPPVPIVYCEECGYVAVPVKQLPVRLPEMEDYQPDDSGLPPLARHPEFPYTTCPTCGRAARRETDVMDNFLDSAWYFIRYPSADREDVAWDPDLTAKWLPVNMYIGGKEHACLHLLYTRFITMALHDLGLLPCEEPFARFFAHGVITKDGAKMSKSRGNVVNPDEYIDKYGADTFRAYLMFLGPYDQGGDFSDEAIAGIRRFLDRFYNHLIEGVTDDPPKDACLRDLHLTIKQVTENLETFRYNTAIAALMTYLNRAREENERSRETLGIYTRLLAPFCPIIAEEAWEILGQPYSVHQQPWPSYDPQLLETEEVLVVVQVNGKLRARLTVPKDMSQDALAQLALAEKGVIRAMNGKPVKKIVHVPNKLLNIVV